MHLNEGDYFIDVPSMLKDYWVILGWRFILSCATFYFELRSEIF
jgi:hypothetical protein